jgi:hypothetical protein
MADVSRDVWHVPLCQKGQFDVLLSPGLPMVSDRQMSVVNYEDVFVVDSVRFTSLFFSLGGFLILTSFLGSVILIVWW